MQNDHQTAGSAEVPLLLLPHLKSIFDQRAQRLASLAKASSLAGWLDFVRVLTLAQHAIAQDLTAPPLPDAASLAAAKERRLPPLYALRNERPPVWRELLRRLIAEVLPHLPENALPLAEALAAADDNRLEALADGLLNGEPDPTAAGELPFIAAALQTLFTAQASLLGSAAQANPAAPGSCPCCGSQPLASIVRLGEVNNLRYLHCSLCNAQWNLPRAVCSACGKDKDLALMHIEGGKDSQRAETCDACKSYLKIFWQDKDPHVEPLADDLASLALDLLVAEAGYLRSGPNLFLSNAAG